MCQDSDGFMLFGSVDGLNLYDGNNIQILKPTLNNPNNLLGNMINIIREAEPGILWIGTNFGLNRYDKRTRIIEYFNEFRGNMLAQTKDHRIFIFNENYQIEYYNPQEKKFISIPFPDVKKTDLMNYFIDGNNVLWIFNIDGNIRNFQLSFDSDKLPEFELLNNFTHKYPVRYCFQNDGSACIIDDNGDLYDLDLMTLRKNFVKNIQDEIMKSGNISSVIRDGNDYFVGFNTNGLIRLVYTPESVIKYKTERIGIHCGVFCLQKDKNQDIIWIGTDGQGVYMMSRDAYSIYSYTFKDLPYDVQKPVRALFLDEDNALWIGTRDDGIIYIRDFDPKKDLKDSRTEVFTSFNSALVNNSNYVFVPSRHNLVWIGGDGPGINYYSYKEKKIKILPSDIDRKIQHVHSIAEVSDSVLWIATGGNGFYRAVISGGDNPRIVSVRQFLFVEKTEKMNNHFFSTYQENDSILWIGSRGYGLIRMNLHADNYRIIRIQKDNTETINDILCIHRDVKGNLWFGSSFGITRLIEYADTVVYKNYNEIDGLPNNTVHGILEDNRGFLWLSTNRGVVEFDPEKENFKTFDHRSGLKVTEFTDGAYYKDEKSGALFWGGTNGFVNVTTDLFVEKPFVPKIYFTKLRIYEDEHNLFDHMHGSGDNSYLQLKYDQNFFSVSFIAVDYINGRNCNYSYNLEYFDDKWISQGNMNEVSFTKVPPGEYILHVRCDNGNKELTAEIYSLKIKILPPWYLSFWAKCFYVVSVLVILYVFIRTTRKRYVRKREAMLERLNQKQKEDVYESKLRFFTNVTHEFCTPLTLIHGPCDRIVSYSGSDSFVKKYASLIMKNAERLNSLIQELIEFRRIETGHKSCVIESLNISDFSGNIADSFMDWSETKKINFIVNIADGICWNTDAGCFSKILINLLSNAFKYTPDEGEIKLDVYLIGKKLKILVYNTGKGIKEKDIPLIFDRYSVLENFEKQTKRGLSSRNGLGLAICHNMVQLLEGEIVVQSVPDGYTEFQVLLPQLEGDNNVTKIEAMDELPVILPVYESERPLVEVGHNKYIKSRPTIMIVDDEPEMLWFISEIFTEHYNVIPIEYPEMVKNAIEEIQPDLIISDIMMPKMDGITLMKQIKAGKRTAHIPFILLSAKNTPEEQTEGIASGAEIYIAKPFNVNYVKSVVNRLLKRQDDLKDYYNSVVSAFQFTEGKYLHKEDKRFFDKIINVIGDNITSPEFSREQLAGKLGLSTRHLYRKMKKITDKTPADLIKEYRLVIVEKLLLTTQFSVDEIMYKAGFSNRGNFYRMFSQLYGMTPKKYRETKTKELQS
ncbi:hybrid sensor histidine kinase/response regulator [Bacteroidia bacterium]|nr:hybrid sensor histidine kinase/response regulator [Bacteroidia bacterium]